MSIILIADDNPQNLYLVRFLLEKNSHEVDEVVNGEQAVQAAQDKEYDLILMDIQMPVLDGLGATRMIKLMANAPIIVALTAKAMAGDAEHILASGCDGYISKPIDAREFMGQIDGFLKNE